MKRGRKRWRGERRVCMRVCVYTSDDTSMPFLMEKKSLIQVVPNVRISAYHR